jgi:hypothetical protein
LCGLPEMKASSLFGVATRAVFFATTHHWLSILPSRFPPVLFFFPFCK